MKEYVCSVSYFASFCFVDGFAHSSSPEWCPTVLVPLSAEQMGCHVVHNVTIIQAFISSHLLQQLVFLPWSNNLQSVQNSPAGLLTKTGQFSYVTPVPASPHWLPVYFRIDLKILDFITVVIELYMVMLQLTYLIS